MNIRTLCQMSFLLFFAGTSVGVLIGLLVVFVYFLLLEEDSTCYLRHECVLEGEWFVPKVVMQTHYDLETLPSKVAAQFEKLAIGFERVLYDDEAAVGFITKHFPNDVAELFRGFSTGAFKADLFRYCYLYVEGGVYLDIKTELVLPLQQIYDDLRSLKTPMATCLTEKSPLAVHAWDWPCVYQGIIFARPKHPIFLECIAYMKGYAWRGKLDYLAFCRNFTKRLHDRGLAQPGTYPREGWTLWSEQVSFSTKACRGEKAKFGACSVISSQSTGEKLFITRFADFPWGKRT